MLKKIVIIALIVLFISVLIVASGIKNAYKFLPIKAEPTLEVPTYYEWREFTAQTKRFKVLLPAVPQYAKESIPVPDTDKKRRYEMYISQKLDGPIFMISLITYPDDIDTSSANVVLNDVLEEMMRTKQDNRLKEVNESKFQKYSAIDFKLSNNTYDIVGKAFLVNKTVYLLTYIAKPAAFTIGDYEHFIKSFILLPKADEKEVSLSPSSNRKDLK